MACVTTYEYEPLEGEHFIRLLKIRGFNAFPAPIFPPSMTSLLPEFDIIHASLDDEDILYETLSYAWGDSTRVGELPVAETGTHIALTQSLVNALPHLVRHCRTGTLWIDQLCINQKDDPEREQQVSVMGDVFRTSSMTFVWLGLDDASGRLAVEWIEHIAKHDITHPRGSLEYAEGLSDLWIKHEAHMPTREHVSAVVSAKNSAWFSRGWIIQEFLLSKAVEFLWGGRAISEPDFSTLRYACSPNLASTHGLHGPINFAVLESARGKLAVNQDLEYSQLLYIISRLSGFHENDNRT